MILFHSFIAFFDLMTKKEEEEVKNQFRALELNLFLFRLSNTSNRLMPFNRENKIKTYFFATFYFLF
jgi:hypothetical protein